MQAETSSSKRTYFVSGTPKCFFSTATSEDPPSWLPQEPNLCPLLSASRLGCGPYWVGFYNGLNISDVPAFYMRFLLAWGSPINIGKLASDPQGSVRLHFLRAGTVRRSLPLNALGSDPQHNTHMHASVLLHGT